MNIIFIRHAKAQDRAKFRSTGLEDNLRPLTKDGATEFKKLVKLYKKILPKPTAIYASPLVRAQKTGTILTASYNLKLKTTALLSLGVSPKKLYNWCLRQGQNSTLILIGHEPDLTRHAHFFIFKRFGALCELKKGGMIWVELKKGQLGVLKCVLQPAQLKKLLKK